MANIPVPESNASAFCSTVLSLFRQIQNYRHRTANLRWSGLCFSACGFYGVAAANVGAFAHIAVSNKVNIVAPLGRSIRLIQTTVYFGFVFLIAEFHLVEIVKVPISVLFHEYSLSE